jgi:[acyl-carrier-protein] S-malonyltransferase
VTTAFVFPGQGSQKVGMGSAWVAQLAVCRETFAEADDVLGMALSRLCLEGPEADLQLTANTQPAILTVSVAIHRALVAAGSAPTAACHAGHSLGEYSAHVAAGTLSFADALRLVRRRGELMQEAVPVGQGAMAAVLGGDAAQIAALAVAAAGVSGEVCVVANDNAPGQTVIAGHQAAVARAIALAKDFGARKAMLLPVSAPFHSPLMAPARLGLEPMLAASVFSDPRPPVVVNVDALPVTSAAAARDALVRQIDAPVRWVESVRCMTGLGVDRFIELGPGAVLAGMIKRIAEGVATVSVSEPEHLATLLG